MDRPHRPKKRNWSGLFFGLCVASAPSWCFHSSAWRPRRQDLVARGAAKAASAEVAELTAAVEGIQSAGPSGVKQWCLYVDTYGDSKDRDPMCHDADFLRDFVDNYRDGYRMSSPASAIAECAQFELTGVFRDAIREYCAKHNLDDTFRREATESDQKHMIKFMETLAKLYLSENEEAEAFEEVKSEPSNGPALQSMSLSDNDNAEELQALQSMSLADNDNAEELQESQPKRPAPQPSTGAFGSWPPRPVEKAAPAKAAPAQAAKAAKAAKVVADWAKPSDNPLGAEGLTQALEQFPSLKDRLAKFVLDGLEASDGETAMAVLDGVAGQKGVSNPTGLVVSLMRTFANPSEFQRSATPFGKEGVEEALGRYPDLKRVTRDKLHLLALTDSAHARLALEVFGSKSTTSKNLNGYLVSLLTRPIREPRAAAEPGGREDSPLGEEGLAKVLEKHPVFKSLDQKILAGLALTNALDVEIVLEDVAQHTEGADKGTVVTKLLQHLKTSEPSGGTPSLGEKGVEQALERQPKLQGKLRRLDLHLLACMEAESAKELMSALSAVIDELPEQTHQRYSFLA